LLIAAFTNEDYRRANPHDFKWMNSDIIDAFISILRKHPTEAEPFLHSIAERIRDVFLRETQSRSDLLHNWRFERLQTFIRKEGCTIPEFSNMQELHPYMDGLAVEMSAPGLAAESLLSLCGALPPMDYIEAAYASASLEGQGYTYVPQNAWYNH
jgi:hypothetical protein